MSQRKPLVIVDGQIQQLQAGDVLDAQVSEVDVVSKQNDNLGAINIGQPVYVKSNGNVDLAQANARLFDADFETIFFNGCCGNINHIDYTDPPQTRGYKVCQMTGYSLAIAVQEAFRCRVPLAD